MGLGRHHGTFNGSLLLPAFPSPAAEDFSSSDSPNLSTTLSVSSHGSHLLSTPSDMLNVTESIPATYPGDPSLLPQSIKTPPIEGCSTTSMNVLVGGALAPVRTEVPVKPLSRPGPGFRLPSFQGLGIATPHLDRYGPGEPESDRADKAASTAPTASREQREGFDLHEALGSGRQKHHSSKTSVSPVAAARKGSTSLQSPLQQYISTLTPPLDPGEMNWQSVPTFEEGSMHSPPTDQGTVPSPQPLNDSTPTMNMPSAAMSAQPDDVVMVDESTGVPSSIPTAERWIDGAVRALLHSMSSSPIQNNPLRILSHALPSPSPGGHIFSDIISAIHESTPISPTIWINVFHAVPGRFNLADLPTSPPSTPGPAVGGEDYFTQKVFDSAVPITDYQDDLSSLPRSPRPAVPPSSINVSIVERYLPPSSPNEFQNMFDANGPSILVDRLIELSPNNGTLIFIYPTRAGAQTFMQDYLSPILDPLLRSLSVINGLSSDLAITLGRMLAVSSLPTFETMQRRLTQLCADLSNPPNPNNTAHTSSAHRFIHGGHQPHHHHQQPKMSSSSTSTTYTLHHASTHPVPLPRRIWAQDWWTKQEKPRVREAVTRYAREAQTKGSNGHDARPLTATELVQQLLEGVCKRPYGDGGDPEARGVGVEVGVFVVLRGGGGGG